MGSENTIGKYAILRELGSGASSKVYLAQDTFNNQQVALKLINPEVINDKSMGRAYWKMLQNEASLVGKLHHPHIVQMLDAVLTEKQSYIVMEYVDGGSLEQYVKEGWLLQFPVVAEHMFKCCKALEYASEQGLIHRDIKPANIMLNGEGEVKISDLGAATLDNADSTQVIGIGSPFYMAPELITGEGVSLQCDIYSLGVTMYQLLTGRLPYTGNNHQMLIMGIVQGAAVPPRTHRPEVPEALEAIVMRAMHRETAKRYQTWAEFAHDLARYLNRDGKGKPEVFDAEKFDALRAIPFFAHFSDAELWSLLPASKWHKIEPGVRILQEGQLGESFYLLTEGVVKVIRDSHVIDFLHKGSFFGEVRLPSRQTTVRSTGIETGTACVLFEIDLNNLKTVPLECRYQFSEALLLALLDRIDATDQRISRLVKKEENFGDATQRVQIAR